MKKIISVSFASVVIGLLSGCASTTPKEYKLAEVIEPVDNAKIVIYWPDRWTDTLPIYVYKTKDCIDGAELNSKPVNPTKIGDLTKKSPLVVELEPGVYSMYGSLPMNIRDRQICVLIKKGEVKYYSVDFEIGTWSSSIWLRKSPMIKTYIYQD
jgi:hypothetical protein